MNRARLGRVTYAVLAAATALGITGGASASAHEFIFK